VTPIMLPQNRNADGISGERKKTHAKVTTAKVIAIRNGFGSMA